MCPPLPTTESPTSLTVERGVLHIAASDFDARPMSFLTPDGQRTGYEPELARTICKSLGLTPVWHNLPMAEFYTCLATGQYDAVWFNQAITPERLQVVDFTQPYGLFDEAVLVKKGSGIASVDDLASKRVGGLADSTNIALVEGFPGATAVPYPGSDQVLPEMLAALRAGDINALIDDELVLVVAAEEDDSLEIAFSLPTRVPFAIATPKTNPTLNATLNAAIAATFTDGTLAKLWAEWIPWKAFPFTDL
ncbi:amino acid ABC transporter substrate-binding protein [Nodosilinea sp. LEGE 06152]|uniref:substrate-binding periplasmic protein n=1 Tax=Nodosilinea sp. LEGE 06152 TaxID=2777966 RepID=UPI001880A616|nr:ABC transporter substrate-binding protein [Nodosilinea sp. LEGE 06152]MBE9156911.1 amino acid ABC transporter substrate-binding protein [Nodosilinea sp. LEGE 06152]